MPTTAPENTKSRPASVFNHRTIKLSVDLPLNERFLAIIRAHITKGGGKITDDVEECDIYICHYREGDDYIYAAQKKKHVGNIAWLLYLVTHDEWTSPLRRLLHYPVPRGGIPGFEGCKITVSNYGGEARTYLENLIRACGAEFTKTMKQDNTHLITARNSSEKCEAALDWNVTMVNHLWIEESYAKCEMQHPSNNKKYTTFPQRTNLSEVIGQTSLDETILREVYYPGGEDVVSEAGSDTASEQENEVEAGEEIAEVAVPVRAKPAAKGKKSPLSKADNSNKAALATPARSTRSGGSGKENVTPASRPSTSRSAKSTALNKLHVLAPDIALYEKEKKRMSNGPFGGKRAASELEKQQAEAAEKEKEKKDAAQDDEDGERPAKRQRSSRPPVQYRICLTGWKRWLAPDVKSVSQEDKERVSGQAGGLVMTLEIAMLTISAAKIATNGYQYRTRRTAMRLPCGPTSCPHPEIFDHPSTRTGAYKRPVLGRRSRKRGVAKCRRLPARGRQLSGHPEVDRSGSAEQGKASAIGADILHGRGASWT